MRDVTKPPVDHAKAIVSIMKAHKDPKVVQVALQVYAKVHGVDDALIVIDPDDHPTSTAP